MPDPHRSGARALLLALLLGLPLLAAAAPRIGLLTMGPGEEYWARFGHNAILVQDPAATADGIVYNFGYFDFEEPGFLWRFLRGRPVYRLVALPFRRDLAGYAAERRGVELQWLDLSPERAQTLANRLAWNAREENASYPYDYFVANCSTRVRDALDEALDGELKRQSQGRSQGLSWRSESLRMAGPLAWMALGIHFGLGPAADRPLSRWDEGFIPDRLAAAMREVRHADGRPVVISEQRLLPHGRAPAPEQEPRWRVAFAASGLVLAGALGFGLGARRPGLRRAAVALAALVWLLLGLAGLGLLALWLATDHWSAWRNANLLLANPLSLLLLAAVPALWRGRTVARGLRLLAGAVFAGALLAVVLQALPFPAQRQLDWLLLLLPLHAIGWWRLRVPG